jgi:hypothetical protein
MPKSWESQEHTYKEQDQWWVRNIDPLATVQKMNWRFQDKDHGGARIIKCMHHKCHCGKDVDM